MMASVAAPAMAGDEVVVLLLLRSLSAHVLLMELHL